MPSRISSTCATAGRARSTCTRAPCAPSSSGWRGPAPKACEWVRTASIRPRAPSTGGPMTSSWCSMAGSRRPILPTAWAWNAIRAVTCAPISPRPRPACPTSTRLARWPTACIPAWSPRWPTA
ncbi:Uncharacterised protein [Bordetella pertussis]|nr:Uncharacterised protein [Bordetella pertussis]